MREIRYNLYLELERKRLFSKEEMEVIHHILGNIDIDLNPTYRCNTFIIKGTKEDPTTTFTKYGNINGLGSGRLQIATSPRSITIKLSGFVDHYQEEMTYTYSKKAYGLLGNKHYERICYDFETREGRYTLSAMPVKKTKNVSVISDFYNRDSERYLRGQRFYSAEQAGVLPTSSVRFNSKNGVSGLAKGAVQGDLRRFIIDSHVKADEEYSKKPYIKRR